MTTKSHPGRDFALRYLDTPEKPLRLSYPQEAMEDDELAQALSDVLFNLCADKQYRVMISRYLSKQLPAEASSGTIRALKKLEKLRRDGFLLHRSSLPYVEERTALIYLAFVLEGSLPAHSIHTSPVEMANLLLKTAGFDRLYARSMEDAGVIFALNNHIDLYRWAQEVQPICDAHQVLPGSGELQTLGDLRAYVQRQETQDGTTVNWTGIAYEELLSLKGGPEVFKRYLTELEPTYFAAARERARLYLCRALLAVIDRQVRAFLDYRDEAFRREGQRFVREEFAEEAEKLWLLGKPMDQIPPPFQSNAGPLSLSAVLQNKTLTGELKAEHFDHLKLRFEVICQKADAFWSFSYRDGPLFSGKDLRRFLSGEIPVSRTMLTRILVFLDGKDAAFVNDRLIRAGFAPLDRAHNVDDALVCALLEQPTFHLRQMFLSDFFGILEGYQLSYPCLRLLSNSRHKVF